MDLDFSNMTNAELVKLARQFTNAGYAALDARSLQEPPKIDPNDDGSGRHYQTRGSTGPCPFPDLGTQLMAVRAAAEPGTRADARLYEIGEHRAALGLEEGIASSGGFLLQTNFANELIGSVFKDPNIIGKINMTGITKGNEMKIPAINETSREDGSRQGGIQMFWQAEASEKQKSKPDFRQIDLKLKKLIGLCYVTDELLEDAPALESYIRRAFNAEMRFVITNCLIRGTGAGQPLGILNSGCLVTVPASTGQPSKTIEYENICSMFSRFGGDISQATWHINQDCWPQLLQMGIMLGLGGAPVLMPPGGGSPYMRLLGIPIIPLEQCATLGSVADILLCDWSKIIGIDKGPMQTAVTMFVQFITDQSVFRFVYRCDFCPELASAITPHSGSANTLSPFVALEARP